MPGTFVAKYPTREPECCGIDIEPGDFVLYTAPGVLGHCICPVTGGLAALEATPVCPTHHTALLGGVCDGCE